MARHLKIAAGAKLVLTEREWRRLLDRTTGHIKIGANAKVYIQQSNSSKQNTKRA